MAHEDGNDNANKLFPGASYTRLQRVKRWHTFSRASSFTLFTQVAKDTTRKAILGAEATTLTRLHQIEEVDGAKPTAQNRVKIRN